MKFQSEIYKKSNTNLAFIGVGLCVVYWLLESLMHFFWFDKGPVLPHFFKTCSHEMWMRAIVMSLLLTFSIYGHILLLQRRRAEAALHKREQELTKILENNPAGIILVDAESRRINWANTIALKMIGSPKDAVEGQICKICRGEPQICYNAQSSDQSEGTLITASGIELPILRSITRLEFKGREYLLETFLDLSERKKSEYQTKLAHAELNQIFQTASVGMRVIDKNFRILRINRRFENLAGVNEKDAIGAKCSEIFGGSMCNTSGCPLTLILQGEEWVDCYVEKQGRDGTVVPCILSANPFKGPDGRILGIVESFQDISALKSAQQAILFERDKFDRILTNLSEGVCIINTDYMIEYQNRIFKELIGECEGELCYSSLRHSSSPCVPCLMHSAIASGQVQHSEYQTPEERTFEQSYTPIVDIDEENKAVVLLRDVTEKKALSNDLMHAEQMAVLGEMAAGVAHEINNPINGIINYAQILANKSTGNKFVSDIAQRMLKESNRIARIVEGLLTFAQRKKEERTLFSLEDVLSDSLALTKMRMRRDDIRLQTEVAADLPLIMGQPHEIEQVFINIMMNSVHALNHKYPGMHENKCLKITAEQVNSDCIPHVRISFHDQGSGIPADLIDKVLIPFFSTNTDGKRTGLGLSISHGIVKNHNGQLKIESVEGEFTRVSVELPYKSAL